MSDNPFESPVGLSGAPPATRYRVVAWLLVAMGPLLVVGGVATPFAVLIRTFRDAASSPNGPSPSELAVGVSATWLFVVVGLALAGLGIVMAIVGVVLLAVGRREAGPPAPPPPVRD